MNPTSSTTIDAPKREPDTIPSASMVLIAPPCRSESASAATGDPDSAPYASSQPNPSRFSGPLASIPRNTCATPSADAANSRNATMNRKITTAPPPTSFTA